MKKIIKILILVIGFISFTHPCFAANGYISKGEVIPNTRFYEKIDTIEIKSNMYKIIQDNTGNIMYSLEPDEEFHGSYYYEKKYYYQNSIMDETMKEKIARIIYYGYLYEDRTDIDWYVATQMLIWQTYNENAEIYFIDEFDNINNYYDNKMEIIKKDVEDNYKLPSFFKNENYLYVNELYQEELILKDESGILNDFDCRLSMEMSDVKTMEIVDNTFRFFMEKPNLAYVFITRKQDESLEEIKLYTSNYAKPMISRGKIYQTSGMLTVNMDPPLLTIKVKPEANNITWQEGEFEVYNSNQDKINTITVNETKESTMNLQPGTYAIKQSKTSYGYELLDGEIPLKINKAEEVIELPVELIKKAVQIKMENENTWNENIKFEIYQDNTLVKKVTTNSEGIIKTELPYGTYELKEVTASDKNEKIENFSFTIDENYDEANSITIPNSFITKNITLEKTIIKKDGDISLEKDAEFEIYDKNNNLIETLVTNTKGRASINLKYGTYYIKETKGKTGYHKIEPHMLIVNENTPEIIALESKFITKNLSIKKTITSYDNKEQFEENAQFEIYQSNKVIAEILTNKNGKASISLPYGTYKIKQVEGSYGYKLASILTVKIDDDYNEETINELTISEITKDITIKTENITNNETSIAKEIELEIYNNKNILISTITTNSRGNAYIKLPFGTYKIKRKDVKEEKAFDINEEEENEIITLSKVEFTKEDEDNKNAEFEKQPESNNTINSSNNETVNLPNNLEHTNKVPENNTDDNVTTKDENKAEDKTPINNSSNNEVIESPIKMDKKEETLKEKEEDKTGKITIISKDSLTEKPLVNVPYQIYNKDGDLIKEEKTNDDGIINFDNLKVGKYYLKGLNDKKIEIEVKEGINSNVTISNRTKIDVPKTGTNDYKIPFISFVFTVLIVIKISFQIKLKQAP